MNSENRTAWLSDIRLEGNIVSLEPLSIAHQSALNEAASDGDLWQLWFTLVPSAESIEKYITDALKQKKQGESLPFVVIHKATGQVIGATRFCNADADNHRLEIGYTWYAQSFQRTGVNTECKYLLLTHAFESLEAIAVEFRTSWFNHQSRQAIERLGAKQDGVLRNHRKEPGGGYRDTVVYSIIESEWLSIKKHLQFKIESSSD